LAVGKIRRPHGVHGDLIVELLTDFPERLVEGKVVYEGEKHRELKIRSKRTHQTGLIMGFDGIDTPEEAGQYRNQILYVPTRDVPQPAEGEYFFHQLLDLVVVEDSGVELGTLTEVFETGANDVYVVTDSTGREILLPAIQDVIISIDLEHQRMVVHLIPGLVPTTAREDTDESDG
jgi:16S rRNA processing protein RimM